MTAEPLRAGEIYTGWCSKCHEATPKRYQPDKFVKLQCIQCEQREKGENANDNH